MAKNLSQVLAGISFKRRLKIQARAAMLASAASHRIKSNNSR
ncbi:MAG: hypothetical protein ACYDDT_09465 [Sulfuricella sp.]